MIPHCRSVHGFGMRYALACLFLDADGVVRARRILRPAAVVRQRGASAVIECHPDALAALSPGARITWGPDPPTTRDGSEATTILKSPRPPRRYLH